MGVRREARELALQVLFQKEFSAEIEYQKSLKSFKSSFIFPKETWEYAETLLDGILQNETAIDGLISSYSKNWTSQRMALVDRNILRIAIFELSYLEACPPQKVVVNEAIEISKKYGGTDSHLFINGILGKIIDDKELDNGP